MAKGKKVSYKHKADDKFLMLLAGAAAVIVGFFAVSMYSSQKTMALPTPQPTLAKVTMAQQNTSGETGVTTLQEVNGQVVVTVALLGEPKGASQPAHIHTGSCPNPGAVKYPLTSVVNGQSVTTLPMTLAALSAMGPLAVNVHKSVAQISTYVSCGDISF